jgi:hypothetical protein
MARTGVFISHAHEDRDLAQSLADLLKAALELAPADITCTSDADYGLDKGGDLRDQITQRLQSARALFLLATPSSHSRDWVQYECAVADAARNDGLQFYIVTPLSTHRGIVPDPYMGRVSVTLSCAEEVHAFVKQLRKTFGAGAGSSSAYVEPMLDLIDRSRPLEIASQRGVLEKRASDSERQRKTALVAAAICALFAAVGGGTMVWGLTREKAHATEMEQLKGEHQKALAEKDSELSTQLLKAEMAADEAFKQFSFSGLFQDSRLKPVPCSKVEVFVPDETNGGEREVGKPCDGRGAFIFSGPELRVDARVPIRLRAHLGRDKPFEFLVSRTSASLPFLFREGQ